MSERPQPESDKQMSRRSFINLGAEAIVVGEAARRGLLKSKKSTKTQPEAQSQPQAQAVEQQSEQLDERWLDHLSPEQAAKIEALTTLNDQQKQSLIEHIFAVRKVVVEGRKINGAAAIAQWAEEGGWLSQPNFDDWGIKKGGYKGKTQYYPNAAEWDPAQQRQVTQGDTFRAYDSLDQAVQNYADFVESEYPTAADNYQNAGAYIQALQHQPYKDSEGNTHYKQWATGRDDKGQSYVQDLTNMVGSYELESLVAIPTQEFSP